MRLVNTPYDDVFCTLLNDCSSLIEQLLNARVLSEYTKCTIMDMANKVLVYIARKYENVRSETGYGWKSS